MQGNATFGHAITGGLGVTYLNFNTADPAVSDPKMRRALAMLVDQETIVGELYQGVDQVATSVLLPSSWAYSGDVKQPAFDLAGAQKALDDLGWKDTNGDGIRDKGGKKLTITISTHSEDPNRVQTLEFMQGMFQQAGIDAQIKISDWPSFSTNYVQKSQHQVALLGWLNIIDPDRLMYSQFYYERTAELGQVLQSRARQAAGGRPPGARSERPQGSLPEGGRDHRAGSALLHDLLSGLSALLLEGAGNPGGEPARLPAQRPVGRQEVIIRPSSLC